MRRQAEAEKGACQDEACEERAEGESDRQTRRSEARRRELEWIFRSSQFNHFLLFVNIESISR